jgi:23S rRNA (pseudouridine1915-N3)-methyltransferase
MKIKLLAIGNKMPSWVNDAVSIYQKRLPKECALTIIELEMPKRNKNTSNTTLIAKETATLLNKIDQQDIVIALDERGEMWSTQQLAQKLESWLPTGQNICLIVGGPDGLSDELKNKAQYLWSLSRLTLPHPMIRPLVAEQLYRAWSIITNHPYHRD